VTGSVGLVDEIAAGLTTRLSNRVVRYSAIGRLSRGLPSGAEASIRPPPNGVTRATCAAITSWQPEYLPPILVEVLAEHGRYDGMNDVYDSALRIRVLPARCGRATSRVFNGLFDALKRLRSREVAARDSSHLGLRPYIAERIVTPQGRTIDVNSSAEAGTSFTVRLPR
jgi:hypothetical protein